MRVVLAVCASAAMSADAAPAAEPAGRLELEPLAGSQHSVVTVPGGSGEAARGWGFWGRFGGSEDGSYRAVCTWLADPTWNPGVSSQDKRLLCTVVFSFRSRARGPGTSNGGGLVAQGLIARPHGEALFARRSARRLSVTGGTGPYQSARGYVDLKDVETGTIVIKYEVP
jgi:hypothetical protein